MNAFRHSHHYQQVRLGVMLFEEVLSLKPEELIIPSYKMALEEVGAVYYFNIYKFILLLFLFV
jgi:hypothetical protein